MVTGSTLFPTQNKRNVSCLSSLCQALSLSAHAFVSSKRSFSLHGRQARGRRRWWPGAARSKVELGPGRRYGGGDGALDGRSPPQRRRLARPSAAAAPAGGGGCERAAEAARGLRDGSRRRGSPGRPWWPFLPLLSRRPGHAVSGGAATPGTPPSPAPCSSFLPWRLRWRTPARRGDGGTGQIRRPRARLVAAAAGSGGLDVLLGRWRRPPRAPSRPSSPLLHGRRPWRVPARGHGGEQVPGKRRGGAAAAAPPGAAARPQDHGDEAEDARAEGEGLRVNFPLVEGFFCKKLRICTISAVRAPDQTAGKNGRRGHARRSPFGARIVLKRFYTVTDQVYS